MRTKSNIYERFWSHVNVKSEDECWEWNASKLFGYGQFGIEKGKMIKSHRFSWIFKYGDIPNGLFVCHHCDNRSCCNPKHLFLGTALDNNRDKISKGRTNYSFEKNNGQCKITDEEVIEIRDLYNNGLKQKDIAKIFRLSHQHISDIINNKRRKNVCNRI